jgi:hypothetical protein
MFLWFSQHSTFGIFLFKDEEKDKEVELWVDEEQMEENYGKSGLELERKRYKVVSSRCYGLFQVSLLLFHCCTLKCRCYNSYYFFLEWESKMVDDVRKQSRQDVEMVRINLNLHLMFILFNINLGFYIMLLLFYPILTPSIINR